MLLNMTKYGKNKKYATEGKKQSTEKDFKMIHLWIVEETLKKLF